VNEAIYYYATYIVIYFVSYLLVDGVLLKPTSYIKSSDIQKDWDWRSFYACVSSLQGDFPHKVCACFSCRRVILRGEYGSKVFYNSVLKRTCGLMKQAGAENCLMQKLHSISCSANIIWFKNTNHQQMHKESFIINRNTLLHVSTLFGHLQGEFFLSLR
jgi:hypothetical protein